MSDPTTDALWAYAIRMDAEIRALKMTILELSAIVLKADPASLRENFEQFCRQQHQKLLESCEEHDPLLAARVDKRKPDHLPSPDLPSFEC